MLRLLLNYDRVFESEDEEDYEEFRDWAASRIAGSWLGKLQKAYPLVLHKLGWDSLLPYHGNLTWQHQNSWTNNEKCSIMFQAQIYRELQKIQRRRTV